MARTLVVDTNVVYHLFGDEEQHAEASQVFRRGLELLAPVWWRAELLSALWQAQRHGLCLPEDAPGLLEAAAGLIGVCVPLAALWREALAAAVESGLSPCDTLFVVLAEREGCLLVSYDGALRRKFPAIVRRPAELTA